MTDQNVRNGNSSACVFRYIVAFGALACVLVGIFILSNQSGSQSQELSDGMIDTAVGDVVSCLPSVTMYGIRSDIRKYAHIFEYAVLGLILFRVIRLLSHSKHPSLFYPLILSAFLCFVTACLDEWHQTFVPGRSGSISDVGYDALGFVPGVLFAALLSFAHTAIYATRRIKN